MKREYMDTGDRREEDTAFFRYETNKSQKHDTDWHLQKKKITYSQVLLL